MASGTISGSTSNKYISAKIEWSSTTDVNANTSRVTATLYYRRTNTGYVTEGNYSGSITIDGVSSSHSGWLTISTSWVKALSYSRTISHNSDGTKSIRISGSGSIRNTTLESTSCSGLVTLDKIPRVSSISATNANIEATTTISINRASSSFRDTITYSFGSLSGTIAELTSSTSIKWTIPSDFYGQIPNAKYGTCTLTCKTYNGGTLIGSKTTTFRATASESNCAPDISGSAITIDELTSHFTGVDNKVIRYISTVQCSASTSAKNSATISSISVNGISISNGGNAEFQKCESSKFTFFATDSRGYSSTHEISLEMIDYVPMTINPSAERDTPTGGTVTINYSGNFSEINFGVDKNSLRLYYSYRDKTQEEFSVDVPVPSESISYSDGSYNASIQVINIDYRKQYVFRIKAVDAGYSDETYVLTSQSYDITISAGIPVFSWGKNKVQFNVPVEIVGYNALGALVAMSTEQILDCEITKGSNYSSVNGSATLIGNCLRCYLSANRTSPVSSGNITNELVCTFNIRHNGMINLMYTTALTTGVTGAVGVMQVSNIVNGENESSFDIMLAATAGEMSAFNSYFVMPCSLNLDKFIVE